MKSSAEVGIYQAASQITLIFPTILLGVNLVVSPMISTYYHQLDFGRLGAIYRTSTKWILVISLPLFFITFLIPSKILEVFFGSEYLDGGIILIILAFTQLINLGTGVVAQIMLMTKFETRWFWFTIVASLINIIGNIFFIPILGGVGAAIGSGLALTVLNFLGLRNVKFAFGLFPVDRRIIKLFGCNFNRRDACVGFLYFVILYVVLVLPICIGIGF